MLNLNYKDNTKYNKDLHSEQIGLNKKKRAKLSFYLLHNSYYVNSPRSILTL